MLRVVLVLVVLLSACGGRNSRPMVQTRARAMERLVIPAGTTLSFRTVGRIAASDGSFGAVLSSDVPEISAGSPARIAIKDNQLVLTAVMRAGAWHAVDPDRGGAPLGKLVSSQMDSPYTDEDSAIVTEGPQIRIPPATILIFRLEAPARLTASVPIPSER